MEDLYIYKKNNLSNEKNNLKLNCFKLCLN